MSTVLLTYSIRRIHLFLLFPWDVWSWSCSSLLLSIFQWMLHFMNSLMIVYCLSIQHISNIILSSPCFWRYDAHINYIFVFDAREIIVYKETTNSCIRKSNCVTVNLYFFVEVSCYPISWCVSCRVLGYLG